MTDRIYKTHGVDVLDDMIRHLSEALRDVGLSPDVAEDAGVETFNRLSCHWGGQLIYFPKGVRVRVSRRNRAIYSDFDGHNHVALARKYNLTLQRIYQVVKLCRHEDINNRQLQLFQQLA